MNYRVLDWETYPRKAHFAHFNSYANPYAGITVEVDITGFLQTCKREGYPFFLSFLYCIGNAGNAVPQLRQRVMDEQIIEMESCDTSHTVLHEDGTYGYCCLNCMQPFADYLPEAVALHEKAKTEACLEDGEEVLKLFFISSLPWVHYSSILQPTPIPGDTNPRIVWGKYKTVEGRTTIPVTLLANHALVDGIHLGNFFRALEEQLAAFSKL